MPRRFVDLSIYLENDVISDPVPFGPKIQYHRHEDTAGQIAGFFPGLKKEDLPDGQGWAVENVNLSTHNGTHLDAPYHFHPTMNKGERAITIDEVPLEWCFQPGVKLDFRDKPDGHVITAREVEAELKRMWYDTANAGYASSMAAMLKLWPASQIVFGTDYPYITTDWNMKALRGAGITDDMIRNIESENAKALVPRLKA